jgi:hypothetical protein
MVDFTGLLREALTQALIPDKIARLEALRELVFNCNRPGGQDLARANTFGVPSSSPSRKRAKRCSGPGIITATRRGSSSSDFASPGQAVPGPQGFPRTTLPAPRRGQASTRVAGLADPRPLVSVGAS